VLVFIGTVNSNDTERYRQGYIRTELGRVMAPKMETVTLRDRQIPIEAEAWPIERFRLDLANPRYLHLPEETRKSEETLEAAIWEMDESKDLYQSVKANGGLINPVFVKKDGTTVEGNRRVTVLRHLAKQIDSGKEPKSFLKIVQSVPCKVFPDDFSVDDRAMFLAFEHVSGKKPWPAMNEAAHLYFMNEELGYSLEQLANYLGKSKSYVQQKLWSYQKTKEYWKYNKSDSRDVQKFSFFEELSKVKGALGYSEKDAPEEAQQIVGFVFAGVKDKLFNITGAKDVRRLPEILASPQAKAAFTKGVVLNGRTVRGTEAALRVLEEQYPSTPAFSAIKEALDQLNRMPNSEYREIPEFSRKVELLFELRERVDAMIQDLGLHSSEAKEEAVPAHAGTPTSSGSG
jgi:hypothetical protein